MPIADAATNYTLLTIGDGLVTQVPALIVSTAAGMLVTRSTASSDLGRDMSQQLFTQPRAIGTAAAILLIFALIPGMPKFSFILIGLLTGTLAWKLYQASRRVEEVKEEAPPVAPVATVENLMPLDIREHEVG